MSGVVLTPKALDYFARTATGRFPASEVCPGDWWVKQERGDTCRPWRDQPIVYETPVTLGLYFGRRP